MTSTSSRTRRPPSARGARRVAPATARSPDRRGRPRRARRRRPATRPGTRRRHASAPLRRRRAPRPTPVTAAGTRWRRRAGPTRTKPTVPARKPVPGRRTSRPRRPSQGSSGQARPAVAARALGPQVAHRALRAALLALGRRGVRTVRRRRRRGSAQEGHHGQDSQDDRRRKRQEQQLIRHEPPSRRTTARERTLRRARSEGKPRPAWVEPRARTDRTPGRSPIQPAGREPARC